MKQIELKVQLETIKTESGNQKVLFKTVNILEDVINQRPPQGGFSIKEIVQRSRLLGIVGDFKKDFELPKKITGEDGKERDFTIDDITDDYLNKKVVWEIEDADFEKIQEIVRKMDEGKDFLLISNFIVDFATQFLK